MLVTKEITTETGHRLLNYPGDFKMGQYMAGNCGHCHGHSYVWQVTISGPVDKKTGMVLDFKELKKILNKTIKVLDHGFIISHADPMIELAGGVDSLKKILVATNGDEPNLFIVPFNPTVENIVAWRAREIRRIMLLSKLESVPEEDRLKDEVILHRIKCWETTSSYAEWYCVTAVEEGDI